MKRVFTFREKQANILLHKVQYYSTA